MHAKDDTLKVVNIDILFEFLVCNMLCSQFDIYLASITWTNIQCWRKCLPVNNVVLTTSTCIQSNIDSRAEESKAVSRCPVKLFPHLPDFFRTHDSVEGLSFSVIYELSWTMNALTVFLSCHIHVYCESNLCTVTNLVKQLIFHLWTKWLWVRFLLQWMFLLLYILYEFISCLVAIEVLTMVNIIGSSSIFKQNLPYEVLLSILT